METIFSIIHIIITLVAVFLTAYLSHRYAITREDKNWKRTLEIIRVQEFNKAASIFSAKFVRTITDIRQNVNGAPPVQFLKRDAISHGIAMMKFRPYLPIGKLESFDSTWRDYACPHKDKPDYIDMSPYETQGVEEIKRMRNTAIKRIENLLDFAKPI